MGSDAQRSTLHASSQPASGPSSSLDSLSGDSPICVFSHPAAPSIFGWRKSSLEAWPPAPVRGAPNRMTRPPAPFAGHCGLMGHI